MLFKTIENFITYHRLLSPEDIVILGLSGGPDSIFLLDFLHQYRAHGGIKTIIAAHLDHEWRSASASDAVFCAQHAERYGIEFVHARASDLSLSIKYNGSKEEIGRTLRRFFFEKVRNEHNATKIALAHHAQDQQETFFIRLVRGSTIAGLGCMKPQEGPYVRPLLTINKSEIIEYLTSKAIPYLIDPTNEHESFLRNRIRKHVIPGLEHSDKRFNANFLRTLESLQKTEKFLANLTATTFNEINIISHHKNTLDRAKLIALEPLLLDRVIMHWLITVKVPFVPSEHFLAEIKRFLHNSTPGIHQIHPEWSIHKSPTGVWVEFR